MKDKILKFIQNIKLIFNNKRKVMPNMRFHQPHILEIAEDEIKLDCAYKVIDELDETKPSIAARFLHHVIEMVLPVFSHWRDRTHKAILAHGTLQEHIQAKAQYEKERAEVCLLITNINFLDEKPLIPIQPDVENPGNEIVIQYKQHRVPFLAEHGITEAVQRQSEIKNTLH